MHEVFYSLSAKPQFAFLLNLLEGRGRLLLFLVAKAESVVTSMGDFTILKSKFIFLEMKGSLLRVHSTNYLVSSSFVPTIPSNIA